MSKNVFDKLAQREHENDTKLGMPSTDPAHFDRRRQLRLLRHSLMLIRPASIAFVWLSCRSFLLSIQQLRSF